MNPASQAVLEATLADRLAAEIREAGPMRFDRFMARALYDPEEGYYERHTCQIGRAGDFFTSVSVGSLFGELLGFAFAGLLAELPADAGEVWILEAGAHDGRLAADILGWLGEWQPMLSERVICGIVEPSPSRQATQRRRLSPFEGKVRWFGSLPELAALQPRGVLFSNELLDALPLRRFVWRRDATVGRWREAAVAVAGEGGHPGCVSHLEPVNPAVASLHRASLHPPCGHPLPRSERGSGKGEGAAYGEAGFVWSEIEVPFGEWEADHWLNKGRERVRELEPVLPSGCVWEHPAGAIDWWTEASQTLAAGWLVAIDYGGAGSAPLVPERSDGSLRAFREHGQTADALANPGAQDLTADVPFDLIRRVGEAAGLATVDLRSQGAWLTDLIARTEAPRSEDGFPPWTASRRRQLMTLVHPEHLGGRFQVLIQSRTGGTPGASNAGSRRRQSAHLPQSVKAEHEQTFVRSQDEETAGTSSHAEQP